jgi:hypothetical protein
MSQGNEEPTGQRLANALFVAGVVSILAFGAAARWQIACTLPLQHTDFFATASFYPAAYRVSLSLASGRGYNHVSIPVQTVFTEADIINRRFRDLPQQGPVPAAAVPLVEFFELRRSHITPEELRAYWDSPHGKVLPGGGWADSRVLDVYLVSWLWRIFGVSWIVLYAQNCVASTLCCLLLILLTLRLTGSRLAALCAGALLAASPFESHFTIRTVRDISPFWFATASFTFLSLVVQRFKSWWANGLTWLALGFLAMIGRGWRPDVLALVPPLLVILFVVVWASRRSLLAAFLAISVYLAGVWAAGALVCWFAPPPEGLFHIGYYGNATRANHLGLENSFQIWRDDVTMNFQIRERGAARGEEVPYGGSLYAQYCREMYREALPYYLFGFVSRYPAFYWDALGGFPAEGMLQGENEGMLRQGRLAWALPHYRRIFDPLTALLPWLFVLGACAFYWRGQEMARGTGLLLYSIAYGAALLAMLPERKHLGQLLLPLYVFAGLGLARVIELPLAAWRWRTAGWPLPDSSGARCGLGLASVLALGWAAACAVAYPISLHARQGYLNAIREGAASATEVPGTVLSPRHFAVTHEVDRDRPVLAYLLEISADQGGEHLELHFHRTFADGIPARKLITRHRLVAGRQQLCVTVPSVADTDPRKLSLAAVLPEGATLTSVRRFSLGKWQGLPLSMLFTEKDAIPGAPSVGHWPYTSSIGNNCSSEMEYHPHEASVTAEGLPLAEALHLRRAGLAGEIAVGAWEGSPAEVKVSEGLAQVTGPGKGIKAAIRSRTWSAPSAGWYLLEARCVEEAGEVNAYAQGADETSTVPFSMWRVRTGRKCCTLFVLVELRQGEGCRMVIYSALEPARKPVQLLVSPVAIWAVGQANQGRVSKR